ncbi:hypothetical protein [Streptomyces sp. NRRL S-340]|uniref:hypothetical protein n=1 Tax=Streptomyces sp. NRRL S-340 TaxID=1463901 RepID=UPI000690BD3F|nr:hypothetical protein [Streptomyces sp. NRRL S-340]
MSITEQYLLDVHRARQHGEPEPPAPGLNDREALRGLREERRFRAVLAGRPARGRLRLALSRLLRPARRPRPALLRGRPLHRSRPGGC